MLGKMIKRMTNKTIVIKVKIDMLKVEGAEAQLNNH